MDNWFRLSKDPNKYDVDFSETNKAPRGELLRWLKEKDSKLLSLTFIPLAAYESGIEINNIGILSKNGKTNKNESINIRKAPSRTSKLVMKKKIGTYVNIIGEESEYYLVQIDQKTGYVQKQFVTLLSENPSINAKKVSIYPYDYEDYLIKKYGSLDFSQ